MKGTKRFLPGAVAVLGTLLFLGCTVTFGSPEGRVINVKTGAGLGGVDITLTGLGATEDDYSATTDSNGDYTMLSVTPGQYELTASRSGYAFTKEVVNVSGNDFAFPDIGGFVPGTYDTLTIFAFWDKSFKDVDAHLSYPNTDATSTTVAPLLATGTNYNFYKASTAGSERTWFYPDSRDTTNRTYIGASSGVNPGAVFEGPEAFSFGIPSAELDVDNQGASGQNPGGPETITVRYIPYTDDSTTGSYTSTGTADVSTLPEGTYTWIGVMEYYLQAWNETASSGTLDNNSFLSETNSSGSADAVVYVFNNAGDQIGRYVIPTFTTVKTASVLRINMFRRYSDDTDWFQVLPDIRTVGTIRGLGQNGIVSVQGLQHN